jgi:hypothetical protein
MVEKTQSKVPISLEVSFPENGNRADFRKVVLFKKLDDGESPKEEVCVR